MNAHSVAEQNCISLDTFSAINAIILEIIQNLFIFKFTTTEQLNFDVLRIINQLGHFTVSPIKI